jgi:hypothetical protein
MQQARSLRAFRRKCSTVKVSPPNKVCKRCDALGANGADDIIQIEHAITNDLPDGGPTVPGFADDDILWTRVAPLPGGRTLWRRIELLQPLTTPEAAP